MSRIMEKKRKEHCREANVVTRTSPYLNLREVSADVKLLAGKKYILMATTYQPGEEVGFTLTVNSEFPVHVTTLGDNSVVEKHGPIELC